MKKNFRSITAGLLIFALVTLACNFSIPGAGTVDTAATSVAGTVSALAGTALEAPHTAETTEPAITELPTLTPVEVYPIRVSFASPDGSLYTWADGTGAPQLLLSGANICCSYVSPDGEKIAFTRYVEGGFASLEVINSDGSNRTTLLDSTQAAALPKPADAVATEPRQIAWIPGTHILSFNTLSYFEGPGLYVNQEFYLIDADTGSMSTLLSTGQQTWQFVWSPDGAKVAISYSTGIDVYSRAGEKLAGPVLAYPFVMTASEYAWTAYPVWSSDATTLMAQVAPEDPFFSTGSAANSTVWRVAADGLSGEQVFSGPMLYQSSGESGISPDLSKMLYLEQTAVATDNTYNLILSNVDGSGGVVLATGIFQAEPAWSADSQHFFFGLGSSPDGHAYVGQVDGAASEVMDFANPIKAKWIDDHRYLVSTSDSGRWRLLLGDIAAATGVIYDSGSAFENGLTFSVNR